MPADCPTCARLRAALDDERAITSDAIEAAAIGEAVIAALNGEEVSDFMASFLPVQRAQDLQQVCALLYGDVEAQRRVIVEACAVLGVTEDDEADWPKLPGACGAIKTEVERLRAALATAEQERDTANARLTAIVEAYQDSTGSQTTAEQLPADIADLAQHEGQLAADCDMYEEFMHDLLVAIGADPTAWDSLDEQAKAVEYAKAIARERDELRLTLAAEQGKPEGAPSEGWAFGHVEPGVVGLVWFVWRAGDLLTAWGNRGERTAGGWSRWRHDDRGLLHIDGGINPDWTDRAAMLAADEVKP